MTYKVGPKGQVVIPKLIRDRLGIRPGDEVVIEEADGAARVRKSPKGSVRELRGMLAGYPGNPLADLEAEHRREIERDERRIGELGR